ncbi:MAG: hypothetical protein M1834_001826 [Cirrosporium novae-zelandiae]|nr:MAG: hypothetical protein M1834_001826 [Cirrosporium novae-zelandiae]
MSCAFFKIIEHRVPCQHIREYPRGTAHTQEDVLYLAVKQYIPKNRSNLEPGDVTIIGAHANGFPKELYEPMWDEVLQCSTKLGFRIRSIWIADVAQQGASGVLNEEKLGDEPGWDDHTRDLLQMINQFRVEMPRPIVGIGHSMGGCQLTNLALIHPRLFTTLILLDPVLGSTWDSPAGSSPARPSTFRRDLWPSREEAIASHKRNKFYQVWDRRVLDLWLKYGLRDLPTLLYPGTYSTEAGKCVTLTTTKLQENHTFVRENFDAQIKDGKAIENRTRNPDLGPERFEGVYPFYRPEPVRTMNTLPFIRPSVLYIFGGLSSMSGPKSRKKKLNITGSGTGGSGGVKEGKVQGIVLEKHGHLIAMETPKACAEGISRWIGKELLQWRDEEQRFKEWTQTPLHEKLTLSEEWKQHMNWDGRSQKAKI